MTAPVFGQLPADAVIDLGIARGAACQMAHFDSDGAPKENRPAHRWGFPGSARDVRDDSTVDAGGGARIVTLCDSCARARFPAAFR